jgi:hypothetical protein
MIFLRNTSIYDPQMLRQIDFFVVIKTVNALYRLSEKTNICLKKL